MLRLPMLLALPFLTGCITLTLVDGLESPPGKRYDEFIGAPSTFEVESVYVLRDAADVVHLRIVYCDGPRHCRWSPSHGFRWYDEAGPGTGIPLAVHYRDQSQQPPQDGVLVAGRMLQLHLGGELQGKLDLRRPYQLPLATRVLLGAMVPAGAVADVALSPFYLLLAGLLVVIEPF